MRLFTPTNRTTVPISRVQRGPGYARDRNVVRTVGTVTVRLYNAADRRAARANNGPCTTHFLIMPHAAGRPERGKAEHGPRRSSRIETYETRSRSEFFHKVRLMRLSTALKTLLLLILLAQDCPCAARENPARAREHLNAGVKYLQKGKLRDAEQHLLKAAELNPREPQPYNLLGFICDQTGRPDEAVLYFRKALELDPKSSGAHNNLGSSYFRQGKIALAREQYEQTLLLYPNDPTANYNLGLIDLRSGEPAQALTYLEKARAISPGDQGVLLYLARSYFRVGRKDDGLRTVLQLLKGNPADGGAYFLVGTVLFENQMYELAAEHLEKADQLAPHNVEVLLALAHAYDRLGESEKAVNSVNEFIQTFRQEPPRGDQAPGYLAAARQVLSSGKPRLASSFKVKVLLAEILYLENKYVESVDVLSALAGEGANSPEYFSLLGMCYAGLNDFPNAARAVIRAIDMDPGRSDFYFNLASIYQKAGDNDSAIKVLEKGLIRDRNSPLIFFALGLSYFNLGKYAGAIESFQEALRLQPDFEKPLFFMGRTYSRWGKHSQAVEAYRKAIARRPTFYPAHFQLALVLLEIGRTEEAGQLLEEVVRLDPGHAEAYYQLGKLHAKQGDASRAMAELEKAIALNPEYDDASYQLGRLYARLGNRKKAEELFRVVNERKQKRREKYEETLSRAQ